MKNFLKTVIIKRRRMKDPKEITLGELLTHLEAGKIYCPSCQELSDLSGLKSLEYDECPVCQAKVFVPKKLKNYWMFSIIGHGGMGHVYKAVCIEEPDEYFAIKVVQKDRMKVKGLAESLMQEAEYTTLFSDHRNSVVPVEYGASGGQVYLVTEYIPGITLDEVIIRDGYICERLLVKYMLDLVSVQTYICSKGYLYRDIKPQNMVITPEDDLMLIDYGLCVTKEEAATDLHEDTVLGSSHYIPPERILGEPEDVRSEIYSIGMIMFHCLAGETYFPSGEPQEVAELHVSDSRYENIAKRLPKVSPETLEALERMILREPDERVQTMEELTSVFKYVYKSLHNANYIEGTPTNH